MARDIFDAVDDRIKKKVPKNNSAKVLAVSFGTLTVQMLRSKQIKQCYYSAGKQVNVGDTCTVEWVLERKAWVATAVYSTGKIAPANMPLSDSEFPPPQNIRALQSYPGAVVVQWDVTVNQPLAVEIQWNTIEDEAGATIESVTRAGHAIIETPDDVFVRARSVDLDGERSDWTDWVSAATGVISVLGFNYLGYNTVGGSQELLASDWRATHYKQITVSAVAILQSIGVHLQGSQVFPNTTPVDLQVNLMADDTGSVGHVIAMGPVISTHVVGTVARWIDFPISCELTPGDYWLAFRGSGRLANNLYLSYDSGGSDQTFNAGASITVDHPPFGSTTNASRTYSIRAGVFS